MNENTAKLLEQLANKLGTTSEYLWGVLLRQAPIDATITLFKYILLIIVGVWLYKTHIKLCKPLDDRNNYNSYNDNDSYGLLMVAGIVFYAILAIIAFFCVGDIINGYFNPEYWALDKILSKIHQ